MHAVGSTTLPIEFILAARSTGPILKFGPADAPQATAAVDFGRISVLDVHTRTLRVHNASLIAANLKAFVAGKGSAFAVSVREATLEPWQELDLNISVQLDETYAFNDALHLLVQDGDALEVPLTATGTGNTLYCADLTGKEVLDLGDQFTGTPFTKTVTVENHGRRPMNVAWVNLDLEQTKKDLGKQLRGANGKPDMSLIPAERRAAFGIAPEHAAVGAKQAVAFVVTGVSSKPRTLQEHLQLLAGTGQVCPFCW